MGNKDLKFTDEERYYVERFIERANKLKRSEYLKVLPNKLSLNISFKKGEGVEVKHNLPIQDLQESFASIFRPFYMNDEKINFINISKLVIWKINKQEMQDKLKANQGLWNDILNSKNDPTPFYLNNEHITRRKIIDLFLYGEISHFSNKENIEKLRLLKNNSMGQIEMMFNETLLYLSDLIVNTANLIKHNIDFKNEK